MRHSNWGYKAVVRTESAWGTAFLAVVVGSAALYFGAGYVYNSQTGGTTGVRALPHARYWAELYGLVSDGVAYARNGGRRSTRSGYRPVERVRAKSTDSSTEKSSKKPKKSPSKENLGSGRSKKKRSSKEHGADQATAPVAPVAGDAASPPVASVGTVGTASAGGGRWVHVPN